MDKFWNKVLEIIGMIIGALIFLGVPILFIINIIKGDGFILKCLSAIWNGIGSVVMFFVRILSKILSVFKLIGSGIAWALGKLGILLDPMLEAVPDSPIIPFALFLLLGALFLMLKRPHGTTQSSFDKFVKLSYGWCFAAINLGMIIAGSTSSLIWMSGAFDAYVIEVPMTLLNITEWTGFARAMLHLTLIGGTILSIIFIVEKDIRSFIRAWVGLAFCCLLGYEYMNLRLNITYWLANNLGFIGRLLNTPIGLFDFFILIQFFFGIVVFLLPLDAVKAITQTSQKIHETSSDGSSNTDSRVIIDAPDDFPIYVSDDKGNKYSVHRGGDYIYIELPSGELSTRWEYVKGQPYFYLSGKRFYPHS